MLSKFYAGDKFLPFHQQSDLSCTEKRWENHLLVPDGLVATLNGAKDMGTVCFKEFGGGGGCWTSFLWVFVIHCCCLLASLLVAGGLLVAGWLLVACLLVVAAMYDSLSWIDHVPLILPASQQSPAWWTEMGKLLRKTPSLVMVSDHWRVLGQNTCIFLFLKEIRLINKILSQLPEWLHHFNQWHIDTRIIWSMIVSINSIIE